MAMARRYRNDSFCYASLDASDLFMAPSRRESPMTDRWRSEENHRNYSSRDRGQYRSRSPPSNQSRRPEPHPPNRSRFEREDYPARPNRKRDFSPDTRRLPPRRLSPSPARSPRLPAARNRYPGDSTFTSRDSSPTRFTKRRRTRSPSPSDWSERNFSDRRRFSRSRSRDRYEPKPSTRRAPSPRKASPSRSSRPASRGIGPDIDSYIPERRRLGTPPRQRQRRSPSPRPRSLTPPLRRRSQSPQRDLPSRPDSPSSRYDSPIPTRRGRARENTQARRKPRSRTPSVSGDQDRDSMDGPFTVRGNHGNPNYPPRGRGNRPYNNNRGTFRGSPVANTPTSSHHGSPQSNTSYHGGRGAWEPQQYNHSSGPPIRQNNFAGAGQSQEEYFRSQQQPNHPYPVQSHRPFRGRGQGRGAPHYVQDRRFSNSDPHDTPPTRGRGSHFNNLQWTPGLKRGGANQQGAGPNSIRTSPALPHKDSRDVPDDQSQVHLPRAPQAEDRSGLDLESKNDDQSQNQKDMNKFSFAFKSKAPPQSPARPPAELTFKARQPPTKPAHDRPPPTEPRANKNYDKRSHIQYPSRDDFDPSRRPPRGPQQHTDKSKPLTEPRGRSRSPPPKKLKQEPLKPHMPPEMAISDSVYYRKPGNESVVGAGTYGKVFKAIHIYTKDNVALKKIRMEGERDGFPITAVREIKLLQNLRHKHVVALQEVMVEKNECFMVFEYMSHDLTGLINHPTFRLTAAHRKDLGRQMFEGLEFLHRRGVMHRDIKAANLLISNNGRLKYADFGLARFYTKTRKLDYTNRVITIWYRPPELLLGETQYGPAVDIWSAACVFMEMFTRKAIFPGEGGELSQLERIYNVLGTPTPQDWPEILDMPWYELMQPGLASPGGERKKRIFEANYTDVLSPAAMDLVTQIFRYDPTQRPDAIEILQHEYFTTEEPAPRQPYELAEVGGDWHEYESKAHRRENDRKEKERRKEEHAKEREKRKAREAGLDVGVGGDSKKVRGEASAGRVDEVPAAPLPIGEEEDTSDGEGSARMSMS